jgi:hypothetical protein
MDSVVVSLSKLLPGVATGNAPWCSCPWPAGIMIVSASLASGEGPGDLDTRSFPVTTSLSSTSRQSSRVSSRDQCDDNSLWHWRRRRTGFSPSGRRGNESRGNESRGAIFSSTTERHSVCLTAMSSGEKRRDSASANLFATDGIHSYESWSSSLSSTFFNRRSYRIMGLLDANNVFVTCTTLDLSTQSLNKDIPPFFTSSPIVPMSTIRIALSVS